MANNDNKKKGVHIGKLKAWLLERMELGEIKYNEEKGTYEYGNDNDNDTK